MKNVLKFSLAVFFLLYGHTLVFSQAGSCGEIVPFASEPRVDGCCVTFEMDTTIGVNWILHPGNGLPPSEDITSLDTNSNVVTYCYEPTIQGTIYPNITYADENWKDICSSFYPVTLDCTVTDTCGLDSNIVVDGCCISFDIFRSYKTKITFFNPDGSFNSEQEFAALPGTSTSTVEFCRNAPGDYSFTIECFDENDNLTGTSTHTYTIGTDCMPRCGFDGPAISVDTCCVTFTVHTGYYAFIHLMYYDGVIDEYDIHANTTTVTPNNPNSSQEITFCPPSIPDDYYIHIICFNEDRELVFTHTSPVFHIGECDKEGGPRSAAAENEALLKADGVVNVFPNPTSDRLTINAPNQVIQNVMLLDLSNRLLINQSVNKDDIYTLDLNTIQASGIYYLHIVTDERSYNKKIVVQR